jgi:hypothetical protein
MDPPAIFQNQFQCVLLSCYLYLVSSFLFDNDPIFQHPIPHLSLCSPFPYIKLS